MCSRMESANVLNTEAYEPSLFFMSYYFVELTKLCLAYTSNSVLVWPVPPRTAGVEKMPYTLWMRSPAASTSLIRVQASPFSENSLTPLLAYSFFCQM